MSTVSNTTSNDPTALRHLGYDADFVRHHITISSGSLYYWEKPGPRSTTLIMLHGFTGNHAGLVATGRLVQGARVLIPDLPGFGMSDEPPAPHTIDALVSYMAEFIRALHLQTPPVIHGHSLGSIVAALLAARYPNLCANTLILQNATAYSPLRLTDRRAPGALVSSSFYWVGAHTKRGKALVRSARISKFLTALLTTTKDPVLKKKIEAHHLSDLQFTREQYYYELYRSVLRHEIFEVANTLTQRVVLISGVKDTVSPNKHQHQLAHALQNATLFEIQNTGHLTHFETPTQVADIISAALFMK